MASQVVEQFTVAYANGLKVQVKVSGPLGFEATARLASNLHEVVVTTVEDFEE